MYRGDTLFKVRYAHYKAHFYTWGTPLDAQAIVSAQQGNFLDMEAAADCEEQFESRRM